MRYGKGAEPVQISISLSMPTEEATLPLVRHLCKYALWEIGVTRDCIGDVELALTEACANVVLHARGDDEYRVEMVIGNGRCEIRVVDAGRGLDFADLDREAAMSAESGRGVQLMRALVDRIHFTSEPETGTIVHLVKELEFDNRAAPPFVADRPLAADGGAGSLFSG